MFWTGSDDGLVHLTRNGGASWENVTPKGLEECLVNAIDISPHDPGTAYIATTRYKFNDYTPAMYKTTNYGKTWTNISKGIPYGAFTRVVREDAKRKNLLYAGTEKGMYISWDGGANWESFQLNLPVTPITDLKVHQGDLIVATSGRSFWILDDLELLAQYSSNSTGLAIMQPEVAYNGSWGSPLSGNSTKFKGTHPFQGVNPANGMVLYYQLPDLNSDTVLNLTIKDAQGKVVRTFSSEKDPNYVPHNGGGAPRKPVLSKKKGLNRFVWDLGHPIMPGIPNVYIEANFRGHKAPPGKYTLELSAGGKTVSTTGEILEMPGFETKSGQYEAYNSFMSALESNLTEMHDMVNSLYKVQEQLQAILSDMESGPLNTQGNALLEKLRTWDEDMVQRKSKAYDDVENFPNKFTAEYLFLINQTNSSIPRVNKASRDRRAELDKQWAVLKAKATTLIEKDIPALNKVLWEAGIGAVRMPK